MDINNYSDDIISFQNGVDIIYNGCVTYGSTPTSKTPNAIVTAISNIYTNRYNSGVTAGASGKSDIITGNFSQSVPVNSRTTKTFNFGKTFAEAPTVYGYITGSTYIGVGRVTSKTTTGATIEFVARGSGSYSGTVYWIAVGTLA